jgi:translation initiation factor 1
LNSCVCNTSSKTTAATGSSITIWRERKGRGGKEVSIIRDLPLNSMELQLLASALKKHCGSGGTVNNGCIEIQGNQRDSIKRYLEQQGYQAKLAGS